jgi:hypothetical protein
MLFALDNDSDFSTDVLSRFGDPIFGIIMASAALSELHLQKLQEEATKLNAWSFCVCIGNE